MLIKEYRWFIKSIIALIIALLGVSFVLHVNGSRNSKSIQINGENIHNNQVIQNNIDNQIITKSEYEIEKDKITDSAKVFVTDFYQNLNNHNYDRLEKLYHPTFMKDKEVKKYFSRDRWSQFMTCIDKGIQVTNIEHLEEWDVNNKEKNKRGFHYWVTYFIKEKEYKDDWEMVWVDFEKYGNFRLAKLECKTPGCSNNPFYNHQKYCKK